MTQHDHDQERGPQTRLTDYLFGEMTPEETRAFEAELAASTELREQLEALRRTLGALRESAPAASGGLTSERRAALRAEASAANQRKPVLRFPIWMRAAAALVIFAGLIVLWQQGVQPRLSERGGETALLDSLSQMGYAAPNTNLRGGGLYHGPDRSESPSSDLRGLVVQSPLPQEESMSLLLSMEPAGSPAIAKLEASREKSKDDVLTGLGYVGEDVAGFDSEDKNADRFRDFDDGFGRRYRGEDVLLHLRRHGNETPRDMFFRYYGDNAVVRTLEDPLSTFAADVDSASYGLARNYLVQGHLPPKSAVRTEEFVNSFRHELAPPSQGDFALELEAAPTPFASDRHLLLRVGLKAREVSRAQRKPLNLVFVVDKSGSMAQQNRMELVKNSLELLVDQIRDDDTIGLVTFDSNGHEVLAPTAGAERWKIREALRALDTGGSTNAAEGLFLGYAMAERAFRKDAVNRVVLASDGVANTGETDQAKILAKVRLSAEADVDLTTIGVGMGNHNDVFLERLADEGDGACHYVDSMEESKRVLVDHFTGTMQVIAREMRVQVEFNHGTVSEWRQLGYENRVMRDQDFRNDAVDAGEIGAGHEMVALYELRLTDLIDGPGTLATIRLRWKPDGAAEFVELERKIGLSDARSRWELATPRFRLAGAVGQFAEFLRRSEHARGDSYAALQEQTSALARELRSDAQVVELRDLVDRTASLVRQLWPDDELSLLVEEARRKHLAECELESLPQRSDKVEQLLKEVRLQNEALERRLQELLQPR